MKPVMWKHINEKAKELQPAAIVFIADTYLHKDGEQIDALIASAFGPGINFGRLVEYKKVGLKVIITKTTVCGLDEETAVKWEFLKPWWEIASEEAGSVN